MTNPRRVEDERDGRDHNHTGPGRVPPRFRLLRLSLASGPPRGPGGAPSSIPQFSDLRPASTAAGGDIIATLNVTPGP